MADDARRPRAGNWLDEDAVYLRRLLATLALLAIVYLVWLSTDVLLLAFAAVLLSVLLRATAHLATRVVPVSHRWALLLVVVAIAGALVVVGVLFGGRLAGQLTDLWQRLPRALDAAGGRLGIENAAARATEALSQASGGSLLSGVAGFGKSVFGVTADIAAVVVAGIYLAADPRPYREGLVKLVPAQHHDRIRDALEMAGRALGLWCAGQLATMAIVATASTLAFWWVGLPSPLALGVVAGLTNFIPFAGPLLGALPALVVASLADLSTVLWTAGAILVVQQIEGNLVTPLIQKRAVLLPPALILFALMAGGVVAGWPGLILAVPLTVAVSVFVKKMWIRETLGEPTPIPGEET
jgi:predicted PurR-regulated permease PerM